MTGYLDPDGFDPTHVDVAGFEEFSDSKQAGLPVVVSKLEGLPADDDQRVHQVVQRFLTKETNILLKLVLNLFCPIRISI